MMNVSMTIAHEFERESHRIDQLIWDALALRKGQSALFCGFANNVDWMKRAASIGVSVSVVSDDDAAIRDAADLPVTVVRGSTSLLPARDASFDTAVAFHYLHEVDPLFHANIVSELGRVAKRCVIVEPAPPTDPLGLRIAALYARAKRQLGQFENYHHLDYWRKLVAIVKPDVSCQSFTFLRTPPRQAVRDTVSLIIDTMAAEATPDIYLAELRALAARPDAQLLPQARYVVVGTSAGAIDDGSAGTDFRDGSATNARPAPMKRFVPPSVYRDTADDRAPDPATSRAPAHTVYSAPDTGPEFPEVIPARSDRAATGPVPETPQSARPSDAVGSPIARNAFGLPPTSKAVRAPTVAGDDTDESFGFPDAAVPPGEFGWAWEPPDDAV